MFIYYLNSMKIIKLLYRKFFLSLSISFISSFVIFFIFSLIGSLDEDYLFSTILNISLINSLEILAYVPSFIFLISIILLVIFLKSKNEIIIIKSYMKKERLFIFLLPIVIFFTVLEINKKQILVILESSKANLTNNNDKLLTKILIEKSNLSKRYMVFNNLDINSLDETEYRLFEIINDKVSSAEFSNNVILSNNTLIANNFTRYSKNLIEDFKVKKKINLKFIDLANQSKIVKDISEKQFKVDIKLINLIIFFVLFFNFIFLIFLSRKYVGIKESLLHPILIGITFLIYSFFIFNNSFSFYKSEFEILASLIIGIFFLKVYTNE